MRIISGTLRGRRIKTVEHREMRPTTDRVREAIFSTLGSMLDFENYVVADLYSGTGSLGMEALSRSAIFAIFVERDPALCKTISENLDALGLGEKSAVLCGALPGALTALSRQLAARGHPTLFLIDPPYNAHPGNSLLSSIAGTGLLAPGSVIVYGAPKKISISFPTDSIDNNGLSLKSQKVKTYGDTLMNFFCC